MNIELQVERLYSTTIRRTATGEATACRHNGGRINGPLKPLPVHHGSEGPRGLRGPSIGQKKSKKTVHSGCKPQSVFNLLITLLHGEIDSKICEI